MMDESQKMGFKTGLLIPTTFEHRDEQGRQKSNA